MALTDEQVIELKNQLRSQIGHLPPEQKAAAEKQIDSLSPQALEGMIKQQQSRSGQLAEEQPKGVFRMIIGREIESVVVDENPDALAVMEINPISDGHVIIIPKKPVAEEKLLPKSLSSLAKKISKKLTSKLKAKSVEIVHETKFGEVIVNVIPSYEKPLSLNSPRQKSDRETLEKTAKKLRTIKKPKVIKIKKEKPTPENLVIKLNRRIP